MSAPAASTPTFSVIVPAYQSEATVGAAIESLLAQSLAPLEVLVIDDGSRDGTAAVAEAYGPPVRVIRQENGGTASARNRGIREARGEFVGFLDADDRYEPHRLESIAAKLAGDPTLDGVLTDAALVRPEGTTLASAWWPEAASRDRVDLRAKVVFCALTVRKRVLDEVGPFDSSFHFLEDVEMWHRLLCHGYGIGYVDDPSYLYLINPTGKTQPKNPTAGERELLRVHVRYALARKTPHRWRARLALRATRHWRRWLAARLGR